MKSTPVLMIILVSLLLAGGQGLAAGAIAQPLSDTGLGGVTPEPDVDLIVVRERSYGTPGVDLTPYGIGTGNDEFIQSIYFRAFAQNTSIESSISGSVTFPAGVTILGFVTSMPELGYGAPTGSYSATDALFAVAANPDDYSPTHRGFETLGGAGSSEYICQINDRSFVFGLNVTNKIDDFRVIIDYGNSFPPNLTFRVDLFEDILGAAQSQRGIRVGDQAASTTPGDGDFGEVTHLTGIPLTTTVPPIGGTTPPVAGRNLIYFAREGFSSSYVDALELRGEASVPGLVSIPTTQVFAPRGITWGEDGLLYVVGDEDGFVSIDPTTGITTDIGIPDLNGVIVQVTSMPGDTRLFFLRETIFPEREFAWIDTYDTSTGIFTGDFVAFPENTLPHPVDLLAGTDGYLYTLGQVSAFHQVDPETGAIVFNRFTVPDLTGDNVGGAVDPYGTSVYIARDTSGDTFVDEVDLETGVFTPQLVTIPVSSISNPSSIVVDNDQHLWVFGSNGGSVGLDLSIPGGSAFYQTTCLDFEGTTNAVAVARVPREVSPRRSLNKLDVETPPAPGMVRVLWEDLGKPGTVYNIYEGSIGSYYGHAPSACHLAGSPAGPGMLFQDIPEPPADTYFLVTASNQDGEGSVGARPVSPGGPPCGPLP